MATRLPDEGAATAATPPATEPEASAAAVLFPDVPLVVNGRELLVREYTFGESLEVSILAAPLIADIARTIANGALRYDRVRPLLARHRDIVLVLVSRSAGVEPEWIAGLPRAQGELLVNTWFTVNCGFFVHEAATQLLDLRAAATASTGQTSSSASPAPASEISSGSADTPNGS